jgi:hypothetical protein
MWGSRGVFPQAAAMVVAVVTPVVLCAKATEKSNKNTKIRCLLQKILVITIYFKHIVIPISLIVAWLSLSCGVAGARTTLVQRTPAYWVSPESSCHCKND